MAAESFVGTGAPFAGKYAVERILGVGGMGTVFEARHIRLGHRVAIKVLGDDLRDYPELVTRFEREARAAGALSSRHAVRVFDIDITEDATPFIVMELLSGQDLARIVEREGPQDVGRAVRWIIEACDAIAEAHRLGIVHRDVKPSNLFLTVDGVKVLDFGVAKHLAAKEVSITHAVSPLGTPQYMSPEQVRCAKDIDVRTDVWSLGVTLYELVTGRTPFAHEVPQACIAAIAADPVPDPRTFRADLSPELAEVIMTALEKDPSKRWESVPAFVHALAPFAEPGAEGLSATAETVDPRPSFPRSEEKTAAPVARRVVPVVAFIAAAVLGLGAVVTPKCVGGAGAPETAAVETTPVVNTAPTMIAPASIAPAIVPAKEATPIAPKKTAIAPTVSSKGSAAMAVGPSPVHGGLSSPGF